MRTIMVYSESSDGPGYEMTVRTGHWKLTTALRGNIGETLASPFIRVQGEEVVARGQDRTLSSVDGF